LPLDNQTQFNILRQNLFQQCLPEGEMETQTFERYAFSMFQMERMIKLTALLERRADKALSELGKLQRDRFNANTPTINMAMRVGSAQPDIQAILKGEVPPPEMKPISQQEKEDFFRSIGR